MDWGSAKKRKKRKKRKKEKKEGKEQKSTKKITSKLKKQQKSPFFRKSDQNRPKIDDSKTAITFVFHR